MSDLDAAEAEKYRYAHGTFYAQGEDVPEWTFEHLPAVIEAVTAAGARTILDVGCGRARVSAWIECRHPGRFALHGLDIVDAVDPAFASRHPGYLTVAPVWDTTRPVGSFDAVLCNLVLEHVPTVKIPDSLANLRRLTGKIAFINVSLVESIHGGQHYHLTVKPPEWWSARFVEAGFAVLRHAFAVNPAGEPKWFAVLAEPTAPGRADRESGRRRSNPPENAGRPERW